MRAWLLDAGANILATDSLDAGVRSARGEVCARVLDLITSEWMDEIADLPTMLSGMVGSAQGWVDAPYVGAPAGLREIADSVVTAPRERTWIVPGVAGTGVSGAPDVMRGEETQLLGLEDDGFVVLPGTHTKWAEVTGGRITSFSTCLTGETFGLLRDHGLVGAVMDGKVLDEAAFARGMDDLKLPGGLLHHLFTVRSRTLRGQLEPAEAWSYCSGLLIGSEVTSMLRALEPTGTVRVVASPGIGGRYATALHAQGLDAEVVDGDEVAARGLMRIAQERGVVS